MHEHELNFTYFCVKSNTRTSEKLIETNSKSINQITKFFRKCTKTSDE